MRCTRREGFWCECRLSLPCPDQFQHLGPCQALPAPTLQELQHSVGCTHSGNIPTLVHRCRVISLAGGGWEALGLSKDFRKTPSLSPSVRAGGPGCLFTALRKQEFGTPHSAPYRCPTPLLSNAHPLPGLLPTNSKPRAGHSARHLA